MVAKRRSSGNQYNIIVIKLNIINVGPSLPIRIY